LNRPAYNEYVIIIIIITIKIITITIIIIIIIIIIMIMIMTLPCVYVRRGEYLVPEPLVNLTHGALAQGKASSEDTFFD